MDHSIGDGIIVAALAAAFIGYFYFRHRERRLRLEVVHQERLAAMEKGVPLPELPLDPPRIAKLRDPRAPLLQGIVWIAFGTGGMLSLKLMGIQGAQGPAWPIALPLALLGVGLSLYYLLTIDRES